MTEETHQDPVDSSEGKTSPASAGSSSGGENWERRFKGLQVAYDKLKTKNDQLEQTIQGLQADLEEARQALKGHDTEKKSLADRVTALEGEKSTLQTTISTHEAHVARSRLIMSEFMDLAQFEAKGLLPVAASEEELRTKLTDYRTAVQSMVSNGVDKRLQGQGPVSGSGSGTTDAKRTKDAVYAELVRLAGSRDSKERQRYDEVMREWDELNK